MKNPACLVTALGLLLLGVAAGSGYAQDVCKDHGGCMTTPLDASGNSSCFANMCFGFDPVTHTVTVSSIKTLSATGCGSLVADANAVSYLQKLMEAAEKEAIQISIRCAQCNPPGPQTWMSEGGKCFSLNPSTQTWQPCDPEHYCQTTYTVSCNPNDPEMVVLWGTRTGWTDSTSCEGISHGGFCATACSW